VPWAELHVYSASLEWGAQGAEVAESLRPVLDQALAAKDKGVRIFRPLPDPAMAEVYRVARVHLYPGNDRDVLCTTLGESQAVGLPAVSRDKGAAKERILNGETGYLAPDDDAFANLAVRLLDDRDTFDKLSETARQRQRARGWDQVAGELERIIR
jgi:glycosyltransferase involved in cell wall biosynthesis